MKTEETFLCGLYYKNSGHNKARDWVACQLNDNVSWCIPGSTIKAKRLISSLISKNLQVLEETESYNQKLIIANRIAILKEVLNEIIKFQKQPYEKGSGNSNNRGL